MVAGLVALMMAECSPSEPYENFLPNCRLGRSCAARTAKGDAGIRRVAVLFRL